MSKSANLKVIPVQDFKSMEMVWTIRKEVFVKEQQVDESLEFEYEDESHHFLCFIGEEAAGTARWRNSGKGIKLERFAVLKTYRNQGVGAELLLAILADLPAIEPVYLHAQSAAAPFYAKYGFEPIGEEFYEAGIAHFKMEWRR